MGAVETNRAKIIRRLEAEGWRLLRNGAERFEAGRADRAAASRFVARRCETDRQACGLEMKMTSYIGLIDGKAGAYGVYFPDLPGCTAMGATIDAAVANAAEAMRDWVDATEQKGGVIPAPRALESVSEDPDASELLGEGALLVRVPLVRETGRPVKANLSIDSGVLEAIDAEANRRKLTRSAFIELMARHALPAMAS